MSSLDSIERQVVRALHSIQLYGNFRDRNWSRTIFRTLAKLGDKLKYQTCASGMAEECGCGAWLYDMVWYKEGLGGTLEEVGLVLESEWSRNFGSIKFDFEKLLVAKSKYRVMIFSCPEHAISDYFDRLISIITQCKLSRKGERYLLFAVGAHGGDFEDQATIEGNMIKVDWDELGVPMGEEIVYVGSSRRAIVASSGGSLVKTPNEEGLMSLTVATKCIRPLFPCEDVMDLWSYHGKTLTFIRAEKLLLLN